MPEQRLDRADPVATLELEWESTDPYQEATLSLARHKSTNDSGCAFFAGRDRFDLADVDPSVQLAAQAALVTLRNKLARA